jgi:probable phosphoglycerate mutase
MTQPPKALPYPGETIFLMRHGETRSDGVKRYIGQTDLPLSALGKCQARKWHDLFNEIPLAAIVSSDLSRSRETAAIIAGKRGIPTVAKPGFREISLGSWENMPFAALQENAAEAFRKRGKAIDTHRPPGGESFLDLQQRAVATFYYTVAETSGNVLIVAHAGLNRVILCHLLGMPIANLFRLGQDHACLNTIIKREGGFRVVSFNQTL